MNPDSLADRLPPQDQEAEQAALGAMMMERESIEKALALLRPEDFYGSVHQRVFAAIAFLHGRGEPGDALSVSQVLRDLGTYDDCGGLPYMLALVEMGTPWQVERQSARVRDKATLRLLIAAAQQITTVAHDGARGAAEAVAESARLMASLGERADDTGGRDFGVMFQDFLALDLPKTAWFLDRYIPAGGLTIVAGDAKSGKSMFCWTLAVCSATGQDFLGEIKVPIVGPVIIIDEESPAGRLQQRLRRMARELCAPDEEAELGDYTDMALTLRLNSHWRLHNPDHLARLRAAVHYQRARFVLIDSLHAVSQGSDKDFYRADDARELTQPLLDLAHDEDCTVVVIHHLRKPGIGKEANEPIHRLMDSVDFTAAADSVLGIRTIENTTSRRVKSLATRWDSQEACPDFIIGIADTETRTAQGEPGLTLTWGDFVDAKTRPITATERAGEAVMASLADGKWATRPEIIAFCKSQGHAERTIIRMLGQGVKAGRFEVRREGRVALFRCPKAGISEAQTSLENDDFEGPLDA